MKLLIDVGNTTTRTILLVEGSLTKPRTIETRTRRTADEWWALWKSLYGRVFQEDIQLVGVSVVPEVTDALRRLGRRYCDGNVRFLTSPWEGPVGIGRPDPDELGADRYAGAVGLYTDYGSGIAVDFGTATTVDVVDRKGKYQGGLIHPGVRTGLNGLRRHAALLPGVALECPDEIDTSSTRGALQGGLYYGHAGAVDRMVETVRHRMELPDDPPVVATGGYGESLLGLSTTIEEYDPDLVLKGLSKLIQNSD